MRRGLPIAIGVERSGSRIATRLTLRGRTVAHASARGASAGTRTLRLRTTPAGRRLLRALRRPADAILHVRVTAPSGSVTTATRKVKVRR